MISLMGDKMGDIYHLWAIKTKNGFIIAIFAHFVQITIFGYKKAEPQGVRLCEGFEY